MMKFDLKGIYKLKFILNLIVVIANFKSKKAEF